MIAAADVSAPPSTLLTVERLFRHFGGIRALDGVTLELPEGSIFGIIGPNGAGKTTLINLLTGFIRPTQGLITLRGRRIDGLAPHLIAQLGITRTYQNIKLFRALSARQNVIIGQHAVTRTSIAGSLVFSESSRQEQRQTTERAEELLGLVGLQGKAGTRADNLSYGDQRRLEIARALGANPSLILLDEPAAGMNHAETERLEELIRSISGAGHTVLLVEHNVGLVMSVCSRIAVLNFGTKLAEGTPAEIAGDAAVIEAYLGQG